MAHSHKGYSIPNPRPGQLSMDLMVAKESKTRKMRTKMSKQKKPQTMKAKEGARYRGPRKSLRGQVFTGKLKGKGMTIRAHKKPGLLGRLASKVASRGGFLGRLAGKAALPVAAAVGAVDIGRAVYHGAKAVKAGRSLKRQKATSKAKYGTQLAARQTRQAKTEKGFKTNIPHLKKYEK